MFFPKKEFVDFCSSMRKILDPIPTSEFQKIFKSLFSLAQRGEILVEGAERLGEVSHLTIKEDGVDHIFGSSMEFLLMILTLMVLLILL